MSVQQSVIVGGVVLAVAVVLGTIVARLVPAGSWRRNAEDLGIILGCASAPLALLARFTHHRSWPYAAVIADQFTAALAGVALAVAQGTVRAAYRRSLTAKVRRIGH